MPSPGLPAPRPRGSTSRSCPTRRAARASPGETARAVRCLVVSPTPTHPQDAGNRARIHALLSRLKGFGHRVELLLLLREDVTEDGLSAMRRAWDRVTTVPHDRSAERRSLGDTHALDDWFLPPLEDAVRAAAADGPWDLVLVEYVFLSRALDVFAPPTIRVLDTHDVFADRHRRLEALGLPPGFFHTPPEEEARGLDRADLVLAIQDDERAVFEAMTRAPVVTVGFVPPAATPGRPAPPGLAVGYLGSANPINARALSRFLGALDPAALADRGAVLRVAGGAARHAGPARPGVEPVGPVAEPGDFLRTVDLVVNPHEGGTGLKIKTVEALAHGVPVIGTAEAFRGLGAWAPFHAAEDAPAVAALVGRWAASPAFRAEVAAESAALATRYARRVERQHAIFRDAASLERALRRPRALMVTDVPFWREALGNQARIAELVRATRGLLDLDVLLLGAAATEAVDPAPWLGARSRFLRPAGPATPQDRSLRLTPFEEGATDPIALAATEHALAESRYDLLILQYLRLSYLRHALPRAGLTVLDTHDLMAPRTMNFEHFGREHFLRIGALEEWEILSGFDFVLSIQAAEHAAVQSALPGRSVHLPHTGPDLPFRNRGGPARRVVFVGGDSPMNRDGLRWFVDQVWPAVAREGAALHVAGAVCDALPRPLPPGVVAHGVVADLSGFLDAADVGVNPVFYGGGLKIKTVEYLSRGIPSVLSEEGAYGIGEGEGTAYLVARSRAEYVAHLQRVLREPAHRRAIGEAAFRLGRARFGRPVAEDAARGLVGFAASMSHPLAAVA